jgi:hypothetical protein
MVPCGGIFLGKWHSSFAGSSDGKMNVQSACALNTQYNNFGSHLNGLCTSEFLSFYLQLMVMVKAETRQPN